MQEDGKFIKGAVIITIANIIVKILGAVYRIPLRYTWQRGHGTLWRYIPYTQ